MAPYGALDVRQRGQRDDSDIIAALIRTAFIIAYYYLRAQGYPRLLGYPDQTWRAALQLLDAVVLAAALFNLLLLLLYLQRIGMSRLRPLALLVDLVLIGTAIAVFRRVGYDAFDLYYLTIIPAAVWYRRAGAVTVAIIASLLAAGVPALLFQQPIEPYVATAQGAFLVLIGLIAGYMMRARDAEHQSAMELRQEMRVARMLQSRMLPESLPALSGCDLGVVFEPARSVGGDFYDLRLLDPDHLLIVLADMSGKSVYGLVYLSLVHSHLQAALQEGASPAEAANAVNEGTYEALQPESYAALFIGVLRLSDGQLTYVNCGHVPPRVIAPSGDPVQLSTGSPVIGAVREPRYAEQQATLPLGHTLICFSDGLSEARNRKQGLFGEEQVVELARECAELEAQEVAARLRKAAEHFETRPGGDDTTVIVVRRGPSCSAHQP